MSTCGSCRWYRWDCYGCGGSYCGCCRGHCSKSYLGKCSMLEQLEQQLRRDRRQLQVDRVNRDNLLAQQSEIKALKSDRKDLEEKIVLEEASQKHNLQCRQIKRATSSSALEQDLKQRKRIIDRRLQVEIDSIIANSELDIHLKEDKAQEINMNHEHKFEENNQHQLKTPAEQPTEEFSAFSYDGPVIQPALPNSIGLSLDPSISRQKCNINEPLGDENSQDSDYSSASEDSHMHEGELSRFPSSSLEDLSHLDRNFISVRLRKAASLDDLSSAWSVKEQLLSSTSPVNRFLSYYSVHLSSSEYFKFLKEIGNYMEDMLSSSPVSIQQSFANHIVGGGQLYSEIIKHSPTSQWLARTLVQDLIRDADNQVHPSILKRFDEHWTKLCECYTDDEQVKLLEALWEAKKCVNLTFVQITNIFEIVSATGRTGYDMVCREQSNNLINLKQYWIADQVNSLLVQFCTSESACGQLSNALARTHLSPSFIRRLLLAIQGDDDLPSLLQFIELISKREVSELTVLSVISAQDSSLARSDNRTFQWLTCLLCKLSFMHMSRIDIEKTKLIEPIVYDLIKEDPKIAQTLEEFIYTCIEPISEDPSIFDAVLRLIQNCWITHDIVDPVLQQLTTSMPCEWIAKADSIIHANDKLYLGRHVYSKEELIENTVELAPAIGHEEYSHDDHSGTSCGQLKKSTIDKVLMDKMLPDLKTIIDKQKYEVIKNYQKKLDALEARERCIQADIANKQNERSNLTSRFETTKNEYKVTSNGIEQEEKKVKAEIDKLVKENEENLKKSEEKVKRLEEDVKRLEQKLGQAPQQEPPKDPPKETYQSQIAKLQKKLNTLTTTRSNLKRTYREQEDNYLASMSTIENQIKVFEVDLTNVRTDKLPIKSKIDKLWGENATNFSDHTIYQEVLGSFDKSKGFLTATLRTSDNNTLPKPYSGSALTTWSKDIKQAGSSLLKTRDIFEIITGINEAAKSFNGIGLTYSQYNDLLTVLFPFHVRSKVRSQKDRLVTVFLAAICAFQNGRVCLVTDSKEWHISDSDISYYQPLFEILHLTASKRDATNPTSSCDSNIVYGKHSDFAPVSRLMNFSALQLKQKSIDERYHTTSRLLQSADGAHIDAFKHKRISEWTKEEVDHWASYIQQDDLANLDCSIEGALMIESIVIVGHAASLLQGDPLKLDQRYGLLTLLYPSLDNGKLLLREAENDHLISAMFVAVRSLQMRQFNITSSPRLHALALHRPLFELLNLKLSIDWQSVGLPELTPATPKAESDVAEAEASPAQAMSGTQELSNAEVYNILRLMSMDLQEPVRMDLVRGPTSLTDTLRSAIVEYTKTCSSQHFISLVKISGVDWATVIIFNQESCPDVCSAYYASSTNDQDQNKLVESAILESGISDISNSQLSLEQPDDCNCSVLNAIAYANLITQAMKSGKKDELISNSITVSQSDVNQLRARWLVRRENFISLDREDNYFGHTVEQVEASSSSSPTTVNPLVSPLVSGRQPVDASTPNALPAKLDSSSPYDSNKPTPDSNAHEGCANDTEAPGEPVTVAPSPDEKLPRSADYERLKKQYDSIEECYQRASKLLQKSSLPFRNKPISKWNKQELKNWATYSQSNYEPGLQIELIAGVHHAVKLHYPYSARPTQLLALLTLLHPVHGRGRLAQVNTGEGKSLIVAMLAAIHGLQGKNVDVITSSIELSVPEVKEKKAFFELLSLTVAENSVSNNKLEVYKQQIVYGTANDFQGDILRQEFLGQTTLGERGHEVVLVDEVDNLLFDNRSHSVRLGSSQPGMDHLRLPLAAIWHQIEWITNHMFKYEGKLYFTPQDSLESLDLGENNDNSSTIVLVDDDRDFITKMTLNYMEKMLRDLDLVEREEYKSHFDKRCKISEVEAEIISKKEQNCDVTYDTQLQTKLTEELRKLPWSERPPILEIPDHLRDFARMQLPRWVKHCISARYDYRDREHYTVSSDNRIVPVQYNETGVLEHNMVWSDGLCQFLQIKEGLRVDPEGISTNILPNVCFFKRYNCSIYGLTGTLGESATRSFLEELYGVDFVIIPPFQRNKIHNNSHSSYLCKELRPLLVEEKHWAPAVLYHLLYHAKQGRAVLAICKSIKQAEYFEFQLKKHHDPSKVSSYIGVQPLKDDKIDCGEILLATNIAGRGTDLKTTQRVEDNGGLYVAVTFLPETKRVELQNVGRTARSGKKGLGQLILVDTGGGSIEQLKAARESKEAQITQQALEVARSVLAQYALFEHFCSTANEYLPSAADCESIDRAATIIPQWKQFLAQNSTDDIIDEQFHKSVNSSQSKLTQSMRDCGIYTIQDNDLKEKFLHKRAAFKSAYEKRLLDKFVSNQPMMSDSLRSCLESGEAYRLNRSPLADKYDWAMFERRAVEERWGIWWKAQHFDGDKQDSFSSINQDTLSMLERFDQSFGAQLFRDANEDKLIKNPYFYILKGNKMLTYGKVNEAVACCEKAIELDQVYSLNGRYNKARALLSFKENKGSFQTDAINELKTAKNIIHTLYRPNLMTFESLVGANGQPKREHTITCLQYDLDVICHQEKYIDKAIEVLIDTGALRRKKQFHVEVTNMALNDTFRDPNVAKTHDRSIRQANSNGLADLFTITKKKPYPWFSIISIALISLSQIAVGYILAANGKVQLGMSFIKSGISDAIATIKAAVKGTFDWGSWAIGKAIEIAISVASFGVTCAKEAMHGAKAVGESAKQGFQAAAQALKGEAIKDITIKSATGELVKKVPQEIVEDALKTELKKAAVGELLGQVSKCVADELWVKNQAEEIRQRVRQDLTKAFESNELINKALQVDRNNESSHWQQCFLYEAQAILKTMLKTDKGIEFCKTVGIGTLKNTVPGAAAGIAITSITSAIIQSCNSDKSAEFTKEFIRNFNERIANNHRTDIEQAKQADSKVQEVKSRMDQQMAMAEPPPVDEDNEIIKIELSHASDFKPLDSSSGGSKLRSDFVNLGPSTTENLVLELEESICAPTIQNFTDNVMSGVDYGTNLLTHQLFKKESARNQKFLDALEAKGALGYQSMRTRKQTPSSNNQSGCDTHDNQQVPTEADGHRQEGQSTSENKSTNKNKQQSRRRTPKLEADAEEAKRTLEDGGPLTQAHVEVIAKLAPNQPVIIYDENGERIDAIREDKSGMPIVVTLVKGGDGKPDHFRPLVLTPEQTAQYHQLDHTKPDCVLNSFFVQFTKEIQDQMGDVEGMRKAAVDLMSSNPKMFNNLFKQQAKLKQLAPLQVTDIGFLPVVLPVAFEAGVACYTAYQIYKAGKDIADDKDIQKHWQNADYLRCFGKSLHHLPLTGDAINGWNAYNNNDWSGLSSSAANIGLTLYGGKAINYSAKKLSVYAPNLYFQVITKSRIKPSKLGSTGRAIPMSTAERILLKRVRENPGLGKRLDNIVMNDPRWPSSNGWVKMRAKHNQARVHYLAKIENGKIVAVDDFKFKDINVKKKGPQ